MLPQIFRPDSPVFLLGLPPEHQQKLELMLADLPREVFTASDSLGWVYQFWQSKRKDDINASEVKIGARELPAVTQLFTEPYMVSFLLDNSLGAWWAARRLKEEDLRNAEIEEELRQKASIPGVPLQYLRFVRKEDGAWTPAAGIFENWSDSLVDFKVLDPCCGSGHFLVSALMMLVPMRMELEGISARDAVDAVLHENLHGLEIDKRCIELAAFALALMAWRYPDAEGYRSLPELNVACSGLAINATEAEWLTLANENTNLRIALKELYKQFKDAPLLGSLVNPEDSLGKGSLFELTWEEVSPLFAKAFSGEKDDEKNEIGVVALGISKAAHLLSEKYQLVITNVPYRSSNDLNDAIRAFSARKYLDGATDLATTFLLRIFDFLIKTGNCSIVIPQNWLVQPTYKALRKRLLSENGVRVITRLGPGAFQEISGEVVNVVLLSVDKTTRYDFITMDCGRNTAYNEKIDILMHRSPNLKCTREQLSNPDNVIFLGDQTNTEGFLGESASSVQGIKTGEDDRYKRKFWEFFRVPSEWIWLQSTVRKTSEFGGLEHILYWEQNGDHLARKQGMAAWNKKGVAVSQMSSLPCCSYLGGAFDSNMTAIVVKAKKDALALHGFALSGELSKSVRDFDQSLKPTNSSFEKVVFEKARWREAAERKYPAGLPRAYSDDPTQWIFHGHPAQSTEALQVAVARLLCYRWPAELNSEMELSDQARGWIKKTEDLLPYAGSGGIVCIPPVRGEPAAADRLLNLLVAAFRNNWSGDKLSELLSLSGHAGKTLESWLRDKFFSQHCALFHQRPFIWHIWDGLPDGFAALVNYHKLDRKNLDNLIYSYLGDWINRQKSDQANSIDGAGEKLAAAENLKKRLELILEGEARYDIFVRWKPIEKQPVGWDPDLNDGVRLNIRPFMTVPDVGKRGAGVLRDKPNINWNKDRGKDVPSAPWYQLFKGDRMNDHHLSLEEKMAARGLR
ncbi:MAG: N-6 DNA methylase [Syntrophobacteraceae bacterium]